MDDKLKAINFIQDFGCATLKQLQILFNKKLVKTNSPAIPEADKLILLFEDDSCQNEVVCNTPFIYCVYPSMKILNKRPK